MSHFPNMSTDAIAALTDEHIKKVINLACAEAGIPIFLEPLGPEPVPSAKEDKTFYSLEGWLFEDKETAEGIAKMINGARRVKQGSKWEGRLLEKTYKEDNDEIRIEPVELFSPEAFHRHQQDLLIADEHRKAWEEIRNKYEKASLERRKISDEVFKEINDARLRVNESTRLAKLYDKYVDLSDGNREVAWRFLMRAERLTPEQIGIMKLVERLQLTFSIEEPKEGT